MMTSWYAVHTLTQHEQKVADMLKKQAIHAGLWDKEIFEVLIPVEEVQQTRDGKRRKVMKKVFPGYVLVRMILTEDSQNLVKRVSGVTGFVSSGNKPVPIDDSEVQSILKRLEESSERPRVAWKVGDTVRIMEGPFADFTGRVEEVDAEKGKLKILIPVFGRETPLELEFDKVEKA
jgi:transcriptional antiterminator NusG